MCVTFFTLQPFVNKINKQQLETEERIQFVIGFNRDQQSKRNTDPLLPFQEDRNIYAGRDKISGGTWLGVNVKTGIIVILTNYDLVQPRYGLSRGQLVLGFLKTSTFEGLTPEEYNKIIFNKLSEVLSIRQNYSAFNLLVYNIQTQKIFYICSELNLTEPQILQKNKPYGMCNGQLDDLWEKTKHGLGKFQHILANLESAQKQQKLSTKEKQKDYVFSSIQNLLKDNVLFDQNLEKQASIFIKPYYCNIEKAQRMTKCSFIALITYQPKTNKYQIHMKEITYTSPNLEESSVEYIKVIGEQQTKKQQSEEK